ncbi:MAG: iron response transcriptional regulator IrrA [Xanthobacteraceae bacterium]
MVLPTPVVPAEPQAAPFPRAELNGCPWHDVKALLRQVGLRPTRQRMALGWILFGQGGRHLTAEMLYEEAAKAKVPVSLATVYNTLHQFTEVGLLRQVAADGSKAYFDTNVSSHHHFFVEGDNALLDIPETEVVLGQPPTPPEGYEVTRIDVVVRVRRKKD